MQDLCKECGGTGRVGMRGSHSSPLPKYVIKRCPFCDEEYYSDTCGTCGYTSSISKRKVKLKAVIRAIEEFEHSVGASSKGMTITDFENAFNEFTGTPEMKVVYKRRNENDRSEDLTE